MTTNDIKKSLYRIKPTAKLVDVRKAGIIYHADYIDEDKSLLVEFVVALTDIGDAKFYTEMNAQELIRWMDTYQEN